jgi:small subunit ribosomal protein S1
MSESFAELFEQSLASQRIKPGQILTGLIISVGPDFVVVNVGLKSEAVIEIEQFKNSELGKKLLPPAPELPPPAGE